MDLCPLCQGKLTGEPEENAYPSLPSEKKLLRSVMRVAAFITAVVSVICIAANLSFPGNGWWSIFVTAGLLSVWILVGVAVWKRRNPMKTIVWQLLVISVLALVWDWRTGSRGWSVNFVLPILIPCMQMAVVIMIRILRLYPYDYMLYLILCILAGLVPPVLVLCGLPHVIYPSVICGGVSIVFLAAVILFRGIALKHEIVRRMHL